MRVWVRMWIVRIPAADFRDGLNRRAPDRDVFVLHSRGESWQRPFVSELAECGNDMATNIRVGIVHHRHEWLDRGSVSELTKGSGGAYADGRARICQQSGNRRHSAGIPDFG
jgi:hypothetical protein